MLVKKRTVEDDPSLTPPLQSAVLEYRYATGIARAVRTAPK